MRAKPANKISKLEVLLEAYFFVALLSTTGLDNLLCLTVVLIGMTFAGKVGGLVLSSASAMLAGLAPPFS